MLARLTTIALLAMGITLGTASAAAAKGPVLEVTVIKASLKGSVDAKLSKRLKKSLGKNFGGYKGFTKVATHRLQLNAKREVTLPSGKVAVFTPKGMAGKQFRVNLAIPKSKFDTDLKVKFNQRFYQAFRKKGQATILALYLRKPK